ncbi:hypothetical protein VTJ83DRAFT_1457 [Remersonia thermophila]|uniref:Zn(2)-C6 fungal-type domain-containing protein n=1 Tax=Remersonia thermophila TaxID=72144 RepID=A0ABR4DFX7_9PEZI
MMRTKSIQITKWGTACAQCASAKAKCSGRSIPGSKCERCERLLKQCTDQVHKPRKPRQPRHHSSQTTDSGSPSFDFDSVISTPEYPSSPMASGDLVAESSSMGSYPSQDRPFILRTSSPRNHQGREGAIDMAPASYGDASMHPARGFVNRLQEMVLEGREDVDQVLLSKYRGEMMPQHPFVMIPYQVSASALRTHRPFLMAAIRAVTSFDGLQPMRERMQVITAAIADRMFRQSERSLDLLMGIVVILGWHHYHCGRQSQLNNLLCLAESLISDLGLNKAPLLQENGEEGVRAVEEQRLLLGVWYLRSSAAMHLQQLTSMPFTSYMRRCLAEVQERKDHELDEILVHFVKVQFLSERVAVLKSPQLKRADHCNDRVPLDGAEQEKESSERGGALVGCQAYLDRLARELPSALKDNAMMVTQLNTVALRLAEAEGVEVLHPAASNTSASFHLSFNVNSPTIDALLQATHSAIRCWFHAWMSSVPVSRYRALPAHAIFQLLYAVGAIVRNQPQARAQEPEGQAAMSTHPTAAQYIPHHAEDAASILNRLLSLGTTTGADLDKFWVALGEVHEDEHVQRSVISDARSSMEEYLPTGDDAFHDVMGERDQRSLPPINGPYSILHSQTRQTAFQADTLAPSSGIRAPVPTQGQYEEMHLLSGSASAVPGASHTPQGHAGEWGTQGTWEDGPSTWPASQDATNTNAPERINERMWGASQGNNPSYDWGPDDHGMSY